MKKILLAAVCFCFAAFAADMTDNDGDGLPDIWEAQFGLSTNRATGVDGALGDPDGDGLSNMAEYLAGYTVIGDNIYSNYAWAVAGLSPTNAASANALILDRFYKPSENETNALVTLGWMFTDRDFVNDEWEITNGVSSIRAYDPDLRIGVMDAWNASLSKGRPPEIRLNIGYDGHVDAGSLVNLGLYFWTTDTMDGYPDAIGRVTGFSSKSPGIYSVTNLSGAVKTGRNYIFAWADSDADGNWDASEAAGIAYDVGIGHGRNTIDLALKERTPWSPRFTFSPLVVTENLFNDGWAFAGQPFPALKNNTRIGVRRMTVDGYTSPSYQRTVLDKTIRWRQFLNEGDFIPTNACGMDWGLIGATVSRQWLEYKVYVGNLDELTDNAMVLAFTNYFGTAAMAKAVGTHPIMGEYVYSARPTFCWTMPEEYTAFAIEVRLGSSTGPQIFSSGEVPNYVRDSITGECKWKSDFYGGDSKPGSYNRPWNSVYYWRVMALNSKYMNTGTGIWSDWRHFRLDAAAPMHADSCGELQVVVKHYGYSPYAYPTSNYETVVEVYNNPSFNGSPAGRYTLPLASNEYVRTYGDTTVTAILRGLEPSVFAGDYYVLAYIDSNGNAVRDSWESWGYANYLGTTQGNPYEVRPVRVVSSGTAPVATVYIQDVDSDKDGFPDVFEYHANPAGDFLSLTGPVGTNTVGNTEVNPYLATNGVFWATQP